MAAASAPIAQRLFDARTIIISGEISQKLAARVMAELLALSAASATEPITIYINSQGGHVEAGDTIHDMIRFVTPQVRIVGTGWVAAAGALIFVSVPVGQRYCLPNTRFLLHQPAGGAGGTASDIAIEAREIVKMRERLNLIFARETGPAGLTHRGRHPPQLLARRRRGEGVRAGGAHHRPRDGAPRTGGARPCGSDRAVHSPPPYRGPDAELSPLRGGPRSSGSPRPLRPGGDPSRPRSGR